MKQFLSLLTLILLCTGCNHYYYVQPVHNVPMLKEKNDIRVSGTYEIDDEPLCIELQAAYALTDKIGILADFMSARGGHNSELEDWAKGIYFDGAIGFFKPIKKNSVFEIYGGLGGSSQNHYYVTAHTPAGISFSGTSDLSFTKIFVQPSFGFSYEHIELVASARVNMLNYFRVSYDINQQTDQHEYEELKSLNAKKTYIFLEPAITFRAGWENMKLQLQAATGSYLNNADYPFEQSHITIGLIFSFSAKPDRNTP